MSWRTKSPFFFSSARSTGGGAPSSLAEHFAQIDRLAEVAAVAADQQDHVIRRLEGDGGHACRDSGSGRCRRWRAWAGCPGRWSRCRARRCRRRWGRTSALQASDRPWMAFTNWPMISGRSGLPKLRLSVMAMGSAPTAVRLRQHSATACLPPSNGIGLDIAGRHVGRHRNGLLAADADDARVAAGDLRGVGADEAVILLPHPAPGTHVGRADDLEDRGLEIVGGGHVLQHRLLLRLHPRAGHIPAPRRPSA